MIYMNNLEASFRIYSFLGAVCVLVFERPAPSPWLARKCQTQTLTSPKNPPSGSMLSIGNRKARNLPRPIRAAEVRVKK